MTYHQLNELIRRQMEDIRTQFRTSDMPFEEYLNRVAQLLESRAVFIECNCAMVSRLSFSGPQVNPCVSEN